LLSGPDAGDASVEQEANGDAEVESSPKEQELSSCVSSKPFGFSPGGWEGSEPSRFVRHAGWAYPEEKLKTLLKRNWIDDWYRISLQGQARTHLIQLMTSWDDLLWGLPFYDQLYIRHAPYPAHPAGWLGSAPVYRSFISQRALDEELQDPIAERLWHDYRGESRTLAPRPYGFGLGLELNTDRTPKTYTVVNPGGDELILPCYGLIIEPFRITPDYVTFWPAVARFADAAGIHDPTSVILSVKRTGTKPQHRYTFEIVGDTEPFEPPPAMDIDLDAVLDELGSPQRLERYITPLSCRHNPWR
jgi:hypothetical protein